MNNDNNNPSAIVADDKEQQALSLTLEADEGNDALDMADEELIDACRDAGTVAGLLRAKAHPVDVEAMLKDFHAAHAMDAAAATADKPRRNKAAVWIAAIVATAAAVAALALIHPVATTTTPEDTKIAYQTKTTGDTATKLATAEAPAGSKTTAGTCKVVTATTALPTTSSATEAADEATATAAEPVRLITCDVAWGESQELTLSDGTRVVMHPSSRLMYPEQFTGRTRDVSLEGEAYFVVAKDAQHPFTVHTGNVQTTVLGTEFDVTARKGQPVAVTLVTGHVHVLAHGITGDLRPGMQAVVAGNDPIAIHHGVDTTPLTMWRDGYYYFDRKSAEDILKEIGRAWGMPVAIYTSDTNRHTPLRFIAGRTEKLTSILHKLSGLIGTPITLKDGIIVMGQQ